MLLDKMIADIQARAGIGKVFQLILAVSLLVNILLAATLLTMDRTVRTILTPPEINKTFWVDGRSLGPEYLEQMGVWVIQQFATVTPSSIDYQSGQILRYVHPTQYGELSIRFKVGANRIKAENLSKIFMPREVRISEKGQSLVLIGMESKWIADKRVPNDELKAYIVSFDYDGSKVTIKELRETNPQKPFDMPDAQKVTEAEIAAQQQAQRESMQQPAVRAPEAVEAPQPRGETPSLPPPPAAPSTVAQVALRSGTLPSPQN